MLTKKTFVFIGFALLAVGLVFGIQHVFSLRSAAGDVLPIYSTLRADPLGSKALLESLNEIDGVQATRNYRPLERLNPEQPIALVYLGLPNEVSWGKTELPHFEALIASGSRAIFAFVRAIPEKKEEEEKKVEEKKKEEAKSDREKKREARKKRRQERALALAGTTFDDAAKTWGFRFEKPERVEPVNEEEASNIGTTAHREANAPSLEETLDWHGNLSFADLKPQWKTLYRVDGRPVVIERRWGQGSIVLVADTYLLSNEGLAAEPRPARFIAWLLGGKREIVFDEEHLGVVEGTGVVTLARKYRLYGLGAGLSLVAGLFLWRSSSRFIPMYSAQDGATSAIAGRGSAEGFVSLLRRSVSPSQLLDVCIGEWGRSHSNDPDGKARMAPFSEIRGKAIGKEKEILAKYRTIATALHQQNERKAPVPF